MSVNRRIEDERFLDRVRAARAMSPEERFLAGPRMFADACRDIRASVRMHFPQAGDDDVDALVRVIIDFADARGIL